MRPRFKRGIFLGGMHMKKGAILLAGMCTIALADPGLPIAYIYCHMANRLNRAATQKMTKLDNSEVQTLSEWLEGAHKVSQSYKPNGICVGISLSYYQTMDSALRAIENRYCPYPFELNPKTSKVDLFIFEDSN